MLELQTNRLRILQLDPDHFNLLIWNRNMLDQKLRLGMSRFPYPPMFIQNMQSHFNKGMYDLSNFAWYTNWQIISRAENISVGSFNFKGRPVNGFVEIGYGIDTFYNGRGYATEAVAAGVNWALAQPGILGVTASTFNDNIASHRILKKNGFVIFNRVNNLTWWVKQKQLQE